MNRRLVAVTGALMDTDGLRQRASDLRNTY